MYNGIVMLKKFIEHDKLLLLLLKKSNFTNVQLDTLISYIATRRSNGTLEQMINNKDGPKVTKGSFLRTLSQARGNMRSSIYSIFLLGYLGVVDFDSMSGFTRILQMFEELKSVGQISDPMRVIVLIDRLCDRLSIL